MCSALAYVRLVPKADIAIAKGTHRLSPEQADG
jgi:hypothetical protein